MTIEQSAVPPGKACIEADRTFCQKLFGDLHAATFDGIGITRDAYGVGESVALDIIEAAARSAGLQTTRDAAGNLVAILLGSEPDLPCIACGSHLDSVPRGGNFDGGAGVVAALAILARFRADNFKPRRTLKLYGLRGEESAYFGRAYIGSSALFGRLSKDDLEARHALSGRTLRECMRDIGADVDKIARGEPVLNSLSVAAWLELHIEQGPVLLARELPIGIVTGIRGNLRHRSVECLGEAGHSGAVPRWLRHDAVFAAAELIAHLDRHWRTLLERGRDLVITAGVFGTDPAEHAIARIPGAARFSFEIRSQSEETLDAFYNLFLSECAAVGEERGVSFNLDRRLHSAPAAMDGEWVERLRLCAERLGVPSELMASGAGHDAAMFAGAGIPSAMVFVRNEHGSHNPDEAMDLSDFLSGLSVMRAAIAEAAQ